MATVILPAPLRGRAGGADRLEGRGATAAELLRELESRHPALKGWILDERGRLREHVSLFLEDRQVGPEAPVDTGAELYVMHAISGGAGDEPSELLVGTRKGLFVLRGDRRGPLEIAHRVFPGETVEYAMRDRRTGNYYAAVTHGQFGPHLFTAADPGGEWEQAEGPAFPEGADAAVSRIWVIEPGAEDGVLWAGVAPAALFKSVDGGRTWELNQALWDDPTRPTWEGGAGGLALHSICSWPGDPSRLAVAMSAVGIWITEDGGASWQNCGEGLVAGYLPEDARDTIMLCVHKLERSPVEPETLYLQFHGGVYRSDDAGRRWIDIGMKNGLPAEFGFPIVVDPRDPDRALVIPLVADVDRVTPEGRLRVYETRDRGASWAALADGLPQDGAYLTVLRQGFCHDGREPLGLYFGTESGAVYGSADDGATWREMATHLPPVVAVRASG